MRDDLERAGLARVDLPEHGAAHLPLAGLGGRAVAAFFDGFVVAFAAITVGVLVQLLAKGAVSSGWLGDDGWQAIALPVSAAIALGPVGVPLLFELFTHGQTPGKQLVHLRVVSANGLPASAGQIFLRNVLRIVDFLPGLYALGGIVVFLSASEQRLGDLVAGTVVVREDAGAFEELAPPGGELRASPDLHGVPVALLRAAALLASPDRRLDPTVFEARRATLIAAIRAHRPDLAAEDEAALWTRVVRGLGAS